MEVEAKRGYFSVYDLQRLLLAQIQRKCKCELVLHLKCVSSVKTSKTHRK